MDLQWVAENFQAVDKIGEAKVEGEGHFHVWLDRELVAPTSVAARTLTDLAPGPHALKVSLHNNDHTPAGAEDTITVNVQSKLEAFVPRRVVAWAPVSISFATQGITLRPDRIGAEDAMGEGHAHIWPDGELMAPTGTSPYTLSGLSP